MNEFLSNCRQTEFEDAELKKYFSEETVVIFYINNTKVGSQNIEDYLNHIFINHNLIKEIIVMKITPKYINEKNKCEQININEIRK